MTRHPIHQLRKQADQACTELAEKLDECPEALWAEATRNQFPNEEWEKADQNAFWESFAALHEAEKAAIAELNNQTSAAATL